MKISISRKKGKKTVALLTTMILCLSLLAGFLPVGTKTAQAATYTNVIPNFLVKDVYGAGGAGSSSSYGRSSNVPAPFMYGHGSMNGLAIKAGSTWRLSYCLGYGLSLSHYDTLTEQNNVRTSDSFGTKYKNLESWQKKYIQLAMTFGLNDLNTSHSQASIQSLIRNNKSLYGVTQVMIWTICHSDSESVFRNSTTRNKIRNRYLADSDYSKYDSIYNAMMSAYDGEKPSFAKDTKEECKKLFMNGKNSSSDSTLTLTDSNGLISHGKNNKYSYTEISSVTPLGKTAKSKLKITRNGNQLNFKIGKGDLVEDGDGFVVKLKTYYTSANNKSKATNKTGTAITLQKAQGDGQALGVANEEYKGKTSYLKVYANKIIEAPKFASIQIRKSASDGNVSGFRFLVSRNMTKSTQYGLSPTASQGSLYNQIVYTGTDGTCTLTGLPRGVYDIYEEGYGKCTDWTNLDYMNGATIIENNWTYSVLAQSCILSLYDKYYTSANTFREQPEASRTYANAKGIASHESMARTVEDWFGVRNTAKCTLIVNNDETAEVTIHNERDTNNISLRKDYIDNATYKSQQAVKDGEVFEVNGSIVPSSAWVNVPTDLQYIFGIQNYYNGLPLSQMVVNNGTAKSDEMYTLPNLDGNGGRFDAIDQAAGTKIQSSITTITELSASSGSEKGNINGAIDMSAAQEFLISAENIVKNAPVKIAKRDSESKKIVKKAGFKFEIRDAYTKEKVGTYTTNEDGIANVDTLGYGTYIVKEIEVPKPYKINEQCYYFTIGSDGTENFEDYQVTDVDSELNEGIVAEAPVTNSTDMTVATDEGTEEVVSETDEANTNPNSVDTTETDTNTNYTDSFNDNEVDNENQYGTEDKATLIKKKVQEYITDCKAVNIANQTPNDSLYTMDFYNENQYGKFSLFKTTEEVALDKLTTSLSPYGTDYNFSYEQKELEGATFEIIAEESIEDEEGNIIYAAGDVVTTLTTDNLGEASIPRLAVGKYHVKETHTKEGKVIDTEIHPFEIKHEGQDTDVSMNLFNARQRCKIKIYKKMETSTQIDTSNAYKDVRFGLYTMEDVKDKTGKIVVPANSLLDTTGITVSGSGEFFIGTFNEDVPFGNYYVKELETNSSYEIDTTIYPVTFRFKDYTTEVEDIRVNLDNGGFVINNLKKIGWLNGDKPDNTPTETNDSKIKTDKQMDEDIVSTGDNTPIALMIVACILSFCSLICFFVCFIRKWRKKRKIVRISYCSLKTKNRAKIMGLLLLLMCGHIFYEASSSKASTSSVPNVIDKDYTYTTTVKDYENELPDDTFPLTITEQGKNYTRENITFLLVDKKEVMKKKKKPSKVEYTQSVSGLTKKEYKAAKEKKVTDDKGRKCNVTLTNIAYTKYEKELKQKVSASVQYGALTEEPSVPKEKTVVVKNKVNGKDMSVKMSLSSISKSDEKWQDRNYPFSVTNYDANKFMFEGTVIDNKESISIPEDLVLQHLSLSSQKYRLKSMKWNGAAYVKDNVQKRNITAVIQEKVKEYTAYYNASVPVNQTLYRADMTYNGLIEKEKKTEYKVKAKAKYIEEVTPSPTNHPQKEDKKTLSPLAVVGIVLGVIVIIAFVVVLIYLLSIKNKKRKNKEDSSDVKKN